MSDGEIFENPRYLYQPQKISYTKKVILSKEKIFQNYQH